MGDKMTPRERYEWLKLEKEHAEKQANAAGNAWLRSVFGKGTGLGRRERRRQDRQHRYEAAVAELASEGKLDPSREEVAAAIGIDTRTLYKWRDDEDVSW